jgi:ubiquinone/menaquinone biosynthesis C-methylase UbiE
MKLNLGCSEKDIRPGYINVDFRDIPGVEKVDLSILPWKWEDNSVDEILMLDFLEHFSYRTTDKILEEVWRILKPDGFVDIQVPDFEECARAAIKQPPFYCNRCGYRFILVDSECGKCKQNHFELTRAALNRLYGGQRKKDDGDWHFTAFTKEYLNVKLHILGFYKTEFLEKEHQQLNWNFKIRAFKKESLWDE